MGRRALPDDGGRFSSLSSAGRSLGGPGLVAARRPRRQPVGRHLGGRAEPAARPALPRLRRARGAVEPQHAGRSPRARRCDVGVDRRRRREPDRRRRRTVTTIRAKDGLPSDEASSLCEDRDGSMWIGTYTSGLARMKSGRITSFGIAQGLSERRRPRALPDRAGTLWVATMSGLARFDGRKFVAVVARGLRARRRRRHPRGSRRDALVRRRPARARPAARRSSSVLTTRDGLASNKVMALHEDVRGSLWIGTVAGLTPPA